MPTQSVWGREYQLFLHSLVFFTRLPINLKHRFNPAYERRAIRYLTLVGWLIGLVSAGLYWCLAQIIPDTVAIVFAMLAMVLLTGAFHEDGWADTVDGVCGGWKPEQRLKIMKDSRIGSYGAMALFFILLMKFELLSSLDSGTLFMAILCAPVISRVSCVALMQWMPYVRLDGSSKVVSVVSGYASSDIKLAYGLAIPSLILLPGVVLPLVCMAGVTLLYGRWTRSRIGGYTGDTLGGAQQLSEVACYLGIVAAL